MAEDEGPVVVSMRVKDAPPEATVAGTVHGVCGRCGEAVWLSPSSQRLLASTRPKPPVWCSQCFAAEVALHPGDEVQMAAVPGAMRELARWAIVEELLRRHNPRRHDD